LLRCSITEGAAWLVRLPSTGFRLDTISPGGHYADLWLCLSVPSCHCLPAPLDSTTVTGLLRYYGGKNTGSSGKVIFSTRASAERTLKKTLCSDPLKGNGLFCVLSFTFSGSPRPSERAKPKSDFASASITRTCAGAGKPARLSLEREYRPTEGPHDGAIRQILRESLLCGCQNLPASEFYLAQRADFLEEPR